MEPFPGARFVALASSVGATDADVLAISAGIMAPLACDFVRQATNDAAARLMAMKPEGFA